MCSVDSPGGDADVAPRAVGEMSDHVSGHLVMPRLLGSTFAHELRHSFVRGLVVRVVPIFVGSGSQGFRAKDGLVVDALALLRSKSNPPMGCIVQCASLMCSRRLRRLRCRIPVE